MYALLYRGRDLTVVVILRAGIAECGPVSVRLMDDGNGYIPLAAITFQQYTLVRSGLVVKEFGCDTLFVGLLNMLVLRFKLLNVSTPFHFVMRPKP